MKKWMEFAMLFVIVVFVLCTKMRKSDVSVTHLRCEYFENPSGIDALQPRLSWILESPTRGQKQKVYRILVSSSLQNLNKDVGDLWDSGRVESDQSTQIVYTGQILQSRMVCHWKVCVWDKDSMQTVYSQPAFWSMGLLSDADWKGSWIGMKRDVDVPQEDRVPGPPPPWFRKTFTADKSVRKAVIYATALGLYELYINGERVGEDVFAPEWTDYDKRIQYRAFDVTKMLREGANVLGAVVGDGWYSGYVGWQSQRGHYSLQNGLLVNVFIEYTDGTTSVVATDGTWRCTEGPILSADLLMGESYDARLEMPGWSAVGFDDSKWQSVTVLDQPSAKLVSQPSEPVRITETIRPVGMTEPETKTYVFDLGQNIAGWARLRVSGDAGTKVTLRFAERLNPDGTIYTTNLRKAKATDTYILKGEGEEVFEPRFTFHGFQYVEVTGYPGVPDLDVVTGIVVHSNITPAGSFACSDSMVNQLFSNLRWGQRGNYISIPTDCPQRDERLGWMGDAQVFIRTGSFNFDVAAFFTKWMQDVEDAQSEEGAFPDFAPRVKDETMTGFEAAPAWGDAGVIVPWTVYRVYGDVRILQKHWNAMVRWMDFIQEANPDFIRKNRLNNNYGDWLSIKADTPKDLLATAYWAYDAKLMSRMAGVLGFEEEKEKYESLYDHIKSAFQKAYVLPDGHIKGETQTAYVLALAFDFFPSDAKEKAAEHLVKNIEARDWHLSTGFVGCGQINPVLTEIGYSDVAYRLLLNDTFPSWGYSIKQGATTIWERWDGWTEENGFQDPGMNSFNHYAFGAVGEWLYRFVAGIDLDDVEPGYKTFRIQPTPGGGLDFVKAEYESIQGKIVSGWSVEDNQMVMDVTVPSNTTAEVFIPTKDVSAITESGKPVSEVEGVDFLRMEDGRVVLKVDSGDYRFVFPRSSNKK